MILVYFVLYREFDSTNNLNISLFFVKFEVYEIEIMTNYRNGRDQ